MYQGTNPAAQRSQAALAAAFQRLLGHYPLDEITVTMICQEAQRSRQTFYQLFGSKEAVVEYLIGADFATLIAQLSYYQQLSLAHFARLVLDFLHRKEPLFSQLVRDGRSDLFSRSVEEKLRVVLGVFEEGMPAQQEPLYTFFVAGLSALFLRELVHWDPARLDGDLTAFAAFMGNPTLRVKADIGTNLSNLLTDD